MNVIGLGLGSLKRQVTPSQLLSGISFLERFRTRETERISTRADYEELKKLHGPLHKKIWLEQQQRLREKKNGS